MERKKINIIRRNKEFWDILILKGKQKFNNYCHSSNTLAPIIINKTHEPKIITINWNNLDIPNDSSQGRNCIEK